MISQLNEQSIVRICDRMEILRPRAECLGSRRTHCGPTKCSEKGNSGPDSVSRSSSWCNCISTALYDPASAAVEPLSRFDPTPVGTHISSGSATGSRTKTRLRGPEPSGLGGRGRGLPRFHAHYSHTDRDTHPRRHTPRWCISVHSQSHGGRK